MPLLRKQVISSFLWYTVRYYFTLHIIDKNIPVTWTNKVIRILVGAGLQFGSL
jgi:hypothetical protein